MLTCSSEKELNPNSKSIRVVLNLVASSNSSPHFSSKLLFATFKLKRCLFLYRLYIKRFRVNYNYLDKVIYSFEVEAVLTQLVTFEV
jgi:hypothetical protein